MAIEDTYRGILREAVMRAGGQVPVAKLIGVHQTTISRTLAPDGRATYTTLSKLSRALNGVPSPVVSVRDAKHERWCRVGALLAGQKPALFGTLLTAATEAAGEAALSALESVTRNPMPTSRRKRTQ